MKKLLILLLLVPVLGETDTYKKIINEYDNGDFSGDLKCEQILEIDLDTQKTENYTWCFFQNISYRHIIDRGSFMLMTEGEVYNAIEGLEKCVKYMDDEGYTMECKGTQRCTYEFLDNVFETECSNNDFLLHSGSIFIRDDDKTTFLSKGSALNFIDWLKTLEFK
jgi:hypothetical protein